MPSMRHSPNGGVLAVGIDSSCSVSQKEADYYAKETKVIAEELGLDKVMVCYCDHIVRKNSDGEWWDVFDLSCGDEIEFKLRGGYYTEFDPVMNLLNDYTEDAHEIQALIYFTDGHGDVTAELQPDLPVYWAITDERFFTDDFYIKRMAENLPFGKHIYLDAEEAYR